MSQDYPYPHSDYSSRDDGTHPPDPAVHWFWDSQQQQQLDLTMPGGYPPCDVYPETNLCSPSNAPHAEVHHWNVQQHFPIMPDMSQAYSQDPSELSPLPLPEVHSTFADIVVGSSSPAVPDISLPSPQSVYHTPYTNIAELSPHLSSDTYTSPSSSYLPVPSPFNSPYVQVSPMGSSPRTYSSPGDTYPSGYQNLYPASPGDPYLSGYRNLYPASPSSMASPASFYSLNSPAMASTSSFHSIAATTSPRAAIPYFPPASYEPSASEQRAPSAKRQRVPQAIKLSPKRNRSHKERFFSGGSPGVRVVDVLNGDVTLDGHDERVLEQTGHRQIRVTIQWPGYPEKLSKDRYIAIQDKDTRTYITREELAKQICEYVAEYMKKAVRAPPPPKPDRFWTITAADSPKPGITIDNLWLISVAAANKNIWLAELEVLRY